jgi:hypothetical protein
MRDTRDPYGLGALALYLALSCLFFGRGLIGNFYTSHIGQGADPPLMMWFLVWWPHAIADAVNPFLTHAFWAPSGFNITWSTSIPVISLVAAPVTAMLGPIASLNIFCLLSLPVAAWCTFFLCQFVSKDYWSSVLGGYVFGFCPMLLGQILFGRLHSVWVFPVPLAVYLTIRRFKGQLTPRRFLTLMALILTVQFLCSPEIFATMTLFGAMALALAWLQLSGEARPRLTSAIVGTACSYIIVALAVSPYIYCMFMYNRPFQGPIWSDRVLSADVLNFLIPTPINEFGRFSLFDRISAPFNWGLPSEEVAYLSWPLIVITVLFARVRFREQPGRLLVDSLIAILIFSLGPALMVRGYPSKIGLPWIILNRSLLSNAAPARFSLYAFLIFAVITSLWLSTARMKAHFKFAVAAAIVVCQLPSLSAAYWVSPFRTPEFFRTGLYRDYLAKGEAVFILPAWPLNDSMVWQAQTRMYFNMAQGPGPWPADVAKWPIVDSFLRQLFIPDAPEQFRAYLLNHRVGVVIVSDNQLPTWGRLISTLGIPITVGGVSLYKVLPQSTADPLYTVADMRKRFDNERFAMLLTAVQKYLSSGGNPKDLLANDFDRLDLIPKDDVIGAPPFPVLRHPEENWWRVPNFRYGMYLFVTDEHLIVLGEQAWQPVAQKLIESYRGTATEADFIPPNGSTAPKDDQIGVVVMSFTRQQLAKAAAIANASLLKKGDAEPGTAEDHTGR